MVAQGASEWARRAGGLAGRLAVSCGGAGVVEYAVILGLAIGLCAAGAALVSRPVDSAFHMVAGADDAPDGTAKRSHGSAAAWPDAATTRADLVGCAGPALHRYSKPALAIAFAGLLASLVAVCLRSKRPAPGPVPPADPAPDEEPMSPSLRRRLDAKRQQLWRSLLKDGERLLDNRIEVRHLMTRELTKVGPAMRVEEMKETAQTHGVRHLLVCGEDGRLVGVVSDRDLLGARTGTARDIMSTDLMTVAPRTSIGAAVGRLVDGGISCLPVLEDGRPCGVLTTTDLVLALQCLLQLWVRLWQAMQERNAPAESEEELVGAV